MKPRLKRRGFIVQEMMVGGFASRIYCSLTGTTFTTCPGLVAMSYS